MALFKRLEEYKRRRLGTIESADDATRWALIAEEQFTGCIVVRPFAAFFHHESVWDTFLSYSGMMYEAIHRMPLEKWARYFKPLLRSEDRRVRYGAMVLLHPEAGPLVVSDLVELALRRQSGNSWSAEMHLAFLCWEDGIEFLHAEIQAAELDSGNPACAARAKELRRLLARVVEILTTRQFDESYPIKPGNTSAIEYLKSRME